MVAFVIKDFGGEIPKLEPRLLPDNMASQARNVDVTSGTLDGLPVPYEVYAFPPGSTPWEIRKAYRMPGPGFGDEDIWMPLPSEFSSVVRSPLANDTLHAIYWTNPPNSPEPGAWWNTYERLRDGMPKWSLGFFTPDVSSTLSVSPSSITSDVPLIVRSYLFTFIDIYGYESSPCEASIPTPGAVNATWTIAGFPAVAPSVVPPFGKNHPPVEKMRLYRTIAGDTTGAQFYFVDDVEFGSTTYVDIKTDLDIVDNNILQSVNWLPPVDNLDGLIALTGGMLVGFTGNTLHFCEPNRPHAWPAGYDLSVLYPIVALSFWQQSLIVLTTGFPSSGTGNSPSQFTLNQIQAPEPCIARGSVVTDLAGVFYASQNGLIALTYYGAQNQTLANFTQRDWLVEFKAGSIIACRHRAQYLAINETGMGFIIDYSDQRMGVTKVTPFVNVVSVWNDVFTGDTFMMAMGKVYRWDNPTSESLVYRWRSREFYMAAPVSLGACQISLDPSVATVAPENWAEVPLALPRESPTLPEGVNALFRLFVGPSQFLMHEQKLTQPRVIFRLPSGVKAFNWQFEIVARVPVHSVELASTMRELKGV